MSAEEAKTFGIIDHVVTQTGSNNIDRLKEKL